MVVQGARRISSWSNPIMLAPSPEAPTTRNRDGLDADLLADRDSPETARAESLSDQTHFVGIENITVGESLSSARSVQSRTSRKAGVVR
jgi:hypothetical protein